MKLLQNDSNGNNEIANSNKIFNIGSAHNDDEATEQSFAPDFTSISIPNWCYKKILKSNGTANFHAIYILGELIRLQHLTHSDEYDFTLFDSFNHFWKKFLFTTPCVRRATTSLKRLGLVTRSFYPSRRLIAGGAKDALKAKFAQELKLKLNTNQVRAFAQDAGACL